MEASILEWLGSANGLLVRVAAILFLALNVGAALAVAIRRDRYFVNRWTSPWLAANMTLVGAGLGAPLLTGVAKFAVRMMASTGHFLVQLAQ